MSADTRETMAIALAPVLCIDCATYVPAGWIDFTDAPKCPVTHHSHRVPTATLHSVIDAARNEIGGNA